MADASQQLLSLLSIFPAWLPWLYAFWVPVFAVLDMLTTRRFALFDATISGDPAKHEFNRILKSMFRRWGVDRAVMCYYPIEVFLVLFIPLVLAWGFAVLITQPLFPILPIYRWVDFLERLVQTVLMLTMALMVLNNYLLGNRLKKLLAIPRPPAASA